MRILNRLWEASHQYEIVFHEGVWEERHEVDEYPFTIVSETRLAKSGEAISVRLSCFTYRIYAFTKSYACQASSHDRLNKQASKVSGGSSALRRWALEKAAAEHQSKIRSL